MQPQQKWEYKVEITQDGVHPADLRTLGAQKWELVSETAWSDPKARVLASTRTSVVRARGCQ